MHISHTESNVKLLESYKRVRTKRTIEKAMLIAGISLIGWYIIWILALYWFVYQNAEEDYFTLYTGRINVIGYSRESEVVKRNSIIKILVFILCVPIFGVVLVFMLSIVTFGFFPLYFYSTWNGRNKRFQAITGHEIAQLQYSQMQPRSFTSWTTHHASDSAKLTEMRKNKLAKLIERSSKINKEDFMALMEFSDNKQFMNWIIDLPKNSPLRLEGDQIIFSSNQQLSERERLSTASQLVNEIEKIKTCYYCGSHIKQTHKHCGECGKKIPMCPVCKQPIQFGDLIGCCIYCNNDYHYSHLAEWVKVQGKCAICHESLKETDIIEKQSGKANK